MRNHNPISLPSRVAYKSLFYLLLFLVGTTQIFALDTIRLSKQVAASLKEIRNPQYSTIAFSRILGNLDPSIINELIDFTNVAIVRDRKFRVIDRSKLQLILQEQQFSISGMVTQDTYKELGKLLGVDLFVYGRYYNDTLVLKAIDVESSAIIWADIFQLKELSRQSKAIFTLSQRMIPSIQNDLSRLANNKIQQISFWNIKSAFDSNQVIDFLSVAITKDNNFQVVDRESLSLLLEEQKLSMEDFIDQKKAKRMGELYGIDAFFYGTISQRQGQYIASLKLLNIYSGVIEWADLIRFNIDPTSLSPMEEKEVRSPKQNSSTMVYIPAGNFHMGSDSGPLISRPAFEIPLRAFYMDREEVSNQAYYAFVKKFGHRAPPSWPGKQIPPGQEKSPVVMVNWEDANRYCKSQQKRLPKEVEWEKAFRGPNSRIFPWAGEKFIVGAARTVESGILSPQQVDVPAQDISFYGVHHMAGNVREWVNSYLRPYPGSRFISAKAGHERVIRGGSWAQSLKHSKGWFRDSSKQTYAWKDVGFRCAKSSQ